MKNKIIQIDYNLSHSDVHVLRLKKYYDSFTSTLNHYYTACESLTLAEAKKSAFNGTLEFIGTLPIPYNPGGSIAFIEGLIEEKYTSNNARKFLMLANNSLEFQALSKDIAKNILKVGGENICDIHDHPKDIEKTYHGISKLIYKVKQAFHKHDDTTPEELLAIKHAKNIIHACNKGYIDKNSDINEISAYIEGVDENNFHSNEQAHDTRVDIYNETMKEIKELSSNQHTVYDNVHLQNATTSLQGTITSYYDAENIYLMM